ncbi:TraB/GumN family protein [Paenibacillus pinihumi]|uniref:TraB/GumN family protein n=1 Tax=Paenibacillus pinihumi TaxID=669462 RepID=UPI0009DBBA8C|nr:TraB/GumN family protein [Paenibacillus pinihumi]
MWKEGDYKTLEESLHPSGWDPEYYKGLLTDRDLKMAEKIKVYLESDKKETHMVVVGFGHTMGEFGVVPTLIKDGYKVEKY